MIIKILHEANNQSKLWFAANGKSLKDKILLHISSATNLDLLTLDFEGIEVMDTSFTREAFVKLIFEIGLNNLHPQVILINVDEYVKENLHVSFKDHKCFTLIKNISNDWALVGKVSEHNVETVKSLAKRKGASAKQISIDLGDIGVSTTINRLNQLYNFCICTRKELVQPTGGREYLFKIEI